MKSTHFKFIVTQQNYGDLQLVPFAFLLKYLEHSHSIRKLGQPLVEFLLLVVTGSALQLLSNLCCTFVNFSWAASSLQQQGVIFGYLHLTNLTKVVSLDVFKSKAQSLVSKHLEKGGDQCI